MQRGGEGVGFAGRGGAGITTLAAERGKSQVTKDFEDKSRDSRIRSSGAVRRRDAICWPCLVCLNELLTYQLCSPGLSRSPELAIVTLKRLCGQEGDCIYEKAKVGIL